MQANDGASVLVVDDDAGFLAVVRRILTGDGHEITTAANGRIALQLITEEAFDVIVSDIAMPELDGILLLKIIRQRDLDVPVVLMTGSPELDTAIEGLAHGAFQYLIKPVLPTELSNVVRRGARLHRLARVEREALKLLSDGGLGVADRVGLEASFERALETLWMARQPLVRAADHTLFGYEALLRTNESALPHPGAVLAAAERLGRLPELGAKIRAGCARSNDQDSVTMVNLHARDLMDDDLFSTTSPLAAIASRVVLEVIERAALDDIPDARTKVNALRRMGYRIAIDDLGAGYAGLTSFVALEPEFVKLDRVLVSGVDVHPLKQKLIRSMVALCRDLGIVVVAEGVETVAERDAVVDLGCDLLQGYLFAKPGKGFPAFAWP